MSSRFFQLRCFNIILIVFFLVAGCVRKPVEKEFFIDNPTNEEIAIQIDNNRIVVNPLSYESVLLSAGKHSFTYLDQNIEFVVKPSDKEVVLNPTLQPYIYYTDLYIGDGHTESDRNRFKEKYYSTVKTFDGDSVVVPFKIIDNQLFIEQSNFNWSLRPWNAWAKEISADPKETGVLHGVPVCKLFRLNDFYTEIGEMDTEELKYIIGHLPKKKLSEIEAYTLCNEQFSFDCESADSVLKEIKDDFKSLVDMSDQEYHSIHDKLFKKDIRKLYFTDKDCYNVNDSVFFKESRRLAAKVNELETMNAFIIKKP
ncbi:hypothetical protein [Myroides injenensis]|uniref:hypothetical protein n=1 Tax=Myroides injenensis TaxID=1183151 RepID=UPI0002888597|nr:hypothetical protein [Myroides injenensis]